MFSQLLNIICLMPEFLWRIDEAIVFESLIVYRFCAKFYFDVSDSINWIFSIDWSWMRMVNAKSSEWNSPGETFFSPKRPYAEYRVMKFYKCCCTRLGNITQTDRQIDCNWNENTHFVRFTRKTQQQKSTYSNTRAVDDLISTIHFIIDFNVFLGQALMRLCYSSKCFSAGQQGWIESIQSNSLLSLA